MATRPTTRLRELIQGSDVVVAPGVFDGLSARLARRAGFSAVYATGGGIARAMGVPDLGLLSATEVVAHLAPIVEHAGVPVIADADTGYVEEEPCSSLTHVCRCASGSDSHHFVHGALHGVDHRVDLLIGQVVVDG